MFIAKRKPAPGNPITDEADHGKPSTGRPIAYSKLRVSQFPEGINANNAFTGLPSGFTWQPASRTRWCNAAKGPVASKSSHVPTRLRDKTGKETWMERAVQALSPQFFWGRKFASFLAASDFVTQVCVSVTNIVSLTLIFEAKNNEIKQIHHVKRHK